MNPTEKPLTITLGGKRVQLYFNLNTFDAFERETKEFFLDFVFTLQEAIVESKTAKNPLQILRKMSATKIRAFIWAAAHKYDDNGEPFWPMTVGQISREIDIASVPTMVEAIINGNAENGPEPTESERGEDRPTKEARSNQKSGGTESGPSDEEALASLTLSSGS